MTEDRTYIQDYIETKSDYAAKMIVEKYQKFVYLTIYRILENSEDTKDVTQEVFIKALDSLSKFRGDSSLKTWLYRIAVNMANNSLRKKKFKNFFSLSGDDNLHDLQDGVPNPETEFTNKELQIQFMKAINRLPQKQRETFALRYFEEMPYSEISEILGVSVGALKANYFHAIKKLALYLEKYIYLEKKNIEDE